MAVNVNKTTMVVRCWSCQVPSRFDPAKKDRELLEYAGYVFAGFAGLLLLFTIFMFSRIRLAIAVMKVAAQALGKNISLLLYPVRVGAEQLRRRRNKKSLIRTEWDEIELRMALLHLFQFIHSFLFCLSTRSFPVSFSSSTLPTGSPSPPFSSPRAKSRRTVARTTTHRGSRAGTRSRRTARYKTC